MNPDLSSWHAQTQAVVSDDEDGAVRRCLQLAQQFARSPDGEARFDAANVLWLCVREWAVGGRVQAALTVARDLVSRFRDDSSYRVLSRVAAALSVMAALQEADGQPAAAVATYDEVASLIASSSDLTRGGAGVSPHLERAKILAASGNDLAAVAAWDDALAAIALASAGDGTRRTQQAAVTIVTKLEFLCSTDHYGAVDRLGRQLLEVLRQIDHGSDEAVESPAAPDLPNASLAAALADIVNDGACWFVFSGENAIAPQDALEQAHYLYAASHSALSSTAAPVVAAVGLVRSVADGYALLSTPRSAEKLSTLPIRQRSDLHLSQFLREHGVDEWARGEGHPLSLVEPTTSVQPSARSDVSARSTDSSIVAASFRASTVKAIYLFEFMLMLRNSMRGLAALRVPEIQLRASEELRAAIEWSRYVSEVSDSDQRVGIAVVCRVIAQTLFGVAYSPSGSAPPALPDPTWLRQMIRETGGYAWLHEQELPVASWAQDDRA